MGDRASIWPFRLMPDQIERNTIYQADRLAFLDKIDDASVDLAILDPPYNMGKAPWDVFDDDGAFMAFIVETFTALLPKLKPAASLYIFNTARNLAYILGLAEHCYKLKLLNWLTWDKRDGMGNAVVRFSPRSEHILLMAHGSGHTFHRNAVRVPYESTDRIRQAAKTGIKKGGRRWFPHPDGRLCGDVWHFPSERHQTKVRGRTQKPKHPTQKPLAMFLRMIAASSNPGDLVLDPFVGSGTTAIACHQLGRDFLCCDSSAEYVNIALANLAELRQAHR